MKSEHRPKNLKEAEDMLRIATDALNSGVELPPDESSDLNLAVSLLKEDIKKFKEAKSA